MIRTIGILFLSGAFVCGQPASKVAPAVPAEGDILAEEQHREDLEVMARQMKFDGLLVETSSGKIETVGDSAEAATLKGQVNEARHKYVVLMSSDEKQQAGILAEYVRNIAGEDEKGFNSQFGKEMISVCCPPSISESLLPALARAFLAREPYTVKTVSEKQYGGRKKLYGQGANGGFVAVTVTVKPSADVRSTLEKGGADVGICYLTTPPGVSIRSNARDTAAQAPGLESGAAGFDDLARDGLGVIVNPLAQGREAVAFTEITAQLSASQAFGVAGEPETAGFLGSKPPERHLLGSYEEVESRVFHEANAWALVPLGQSGVTDNKLLRVTHGMDTYGTRATPLTVARNIYPMTRKIVIGLGPGKAQVAKQFKDFALSALGRAVLIQANFAPSQN